VHASVSKPPGHGVPAPEVRRASDDESVPVARLLARAFAEDPIEVWCLACDDLPRLMELEFLQATRQLSAEGSLWVTGDLSGVAAWLPPGTHYNESIDAVVNPALSAHGGQPDRLVRFWEWANDHRPTTPHWYVDLVAVDPDRRGYGTGRLLLEHGLARLDDIGESSFLVTGNPLTVPWYQRHGFVVRSEVTAPDGGPRTWFMFRPPST
jgi:GNAT superfamily N-acetyltransferase